MHCRAYRSRLGGSGGLPVIVRPRQSVSSAVAERGGHREKTKNQKNSKKIRRARRAAWWPRCAARCWRAADRGADSAAAPSHAAGRVASSAPKQTRARGAAAAAKTTTPQLLLLFSSRLVLSQAHTRATCARVAAFAPRRAIRTGSQSAQRRRAAAKRTTLTSWRCCCFGTP